MNTEEEPFTACWLTLFKKVNVDVLVKNGYKILFYISQLQSFAEVLAAFVSAISSQALRDETVQVLAVAHTCFGKELVKGDLIKGDYTNLDVESAFKQQRRGLFSIRNVF